MRRRGPCNASQSLEIVFSAASLSADALGSHALQSRDVDFSVASLAEENDARICWTRVQYNDMLDGRKRNSEIRLTTAKHSLLARMLRTFPLATIWGQTDIWLESSVDGHDAILKHRTTVR